MDRQPGNTEFDAIVVGSGPTGATIARELSKRKKRVLVLERGGNGPLKESFLTMASILNTVSVSDGLSTSMAYTTGGTTAVYFAVAHFPPLQTFLSLGIDISRELEEAKKELPLTNFPDEHLGPAAKRVQESAIDLGHAWEQAPMLVDLSKCPSGYAYEAKWNARSYLRDAVAEGATLVERARVLKVLVEKKRAIGVEYEVKKSKRQSEIRLAFGTKIILAAGAAASPAILRDSGINSVTNSGFYCHPSYVLFGTTAGLNAGDNFMGSMGTVVDGNVAVGDANVPRGLFRMLMLGNRRFVRAFLHSKSIGVGVMLREGLGGGLQEDGRYYKQLTKEDLNKLKKGEQAARKIIERAGGKNIIKTAASSAQIGGTIRINEHLDKNLQTEYSNLHVCDGSVIPHNVNISPTLTLVCLGKYLANHLSATL